jgi:hypothetical protein
MQIRKFYCERNGIEIFLFIVEKGKMKWHYIAFYLLKNKKYATEKES